MKEILIVILMICSCWDVLSWDEHKDPDKDLSLDDLTKKLGLDGVEFFYTTTTDGYQLTILRIKQIGAENLQPLVLVHPITACAESYFATKESSPAIVFAKAGYDVWILSSRGTNYSLNHTRWNASTDREYWMFSWQEIGLIDLPVAIDMALSRNVHDKVILLGHSEGSTVIFVTLSDAPGYDEKTLLSIHWGVSVYHDDCVRLSNLNNICKLGPVLNAFLDAIGWFSLFPTMKIREFIVQLCSYNIFAAACREAAYLFMHKSNLIDHVEFWDFLATKAVCGGSMRELYHFMQVGSSGKFARYDHGPKKNLKIYNSTEPPLFHLENINSPAVLWCGTTDWFCSPRDIEKLKSKLKNVESIEFKGKETFAHIDFLVAKNKEELMYKDLFKILQKYSGTGNETLEFV